MLFQVLENYKVSESGCWEWTGYIAWNGYGRFEVYGNGGRKRYLAHRAAYQVFKGPISDGMHVLHQCDNRSCINPDHLFLGTRSDNMKDAAQKCRLSRGTRKLSKEERVLIAGLNMSSLEIAVYFEITPAYVSNIRSRYGKR